MKFDIISFRFAPMRWDRTGQIDVALPVETDGFATCDLFISGQSRRKRVWPPIVGCGQMSSSEQLSKWERVMDPSGKAYAVRFSISLIALLLLGGMPDLVFAQAASPFMTGATALQTNILDWLTPIAIILVMVLGAMAMANRISWGWCIAAILGIAISFGAPQIVTWVRGMFGV